VSIEGSHKSGREKCLKAVLEVLQQPLPFLKVWHIMKNILEGRVGTGWNTTTTTDGWRSSCWLD